jgi:putative transcriptional regulator
MKVYHYFKKVMIPLKPKNKIKEFRKEKKLKQFALASRVGIHQSEISTIETGERMPSVYLAEKIAKALDKSLDEVFSDGL